MGKHVYVLFRRIISVALCMVMLLSVMPSSVFATEIVEETAGTEAPTETETTPEEESVPEETEAVPEETEAIPEETEAIPEETEAPAETAWELPACDCGSSVAEIIGHSDGCARKAFLKSFGDASAAGEIYAKWDVLPEDCRAYILEYLSWGQQTKLDELNALISADEALSGEAAVSKEDGTVVSVSGIPKDGSMTVAEATDADKAVVEAYVAGLGDDSATELFVWDINILDASGAVWQPDGTTVRVELTIPNVTLHKYASVYVVHVKDGVASEIPAEVTENGGIAFETDGFSTFAGFTVDFEFNGATFSIPGETGILLSAVFDQLRMPLDVKNVANVEFTNYDLVTVTQQDDGDWLLTSLVAFISEEKLTVTMTGGEVYEITVTDAIPYPTIKLGTSTTNQDGGTNGAEDWYLTTSPTNDEIDNSHTEDYDIIIDGTNATNKTFEIVLQRPANATGRTLYLDLHTIWIKGGANLVFRTGSTITDDNTDEIIIRQVRGRKNNNASDSWWFGELFWVADGSLELKVTYAQTNQKNVRMVFDWDSANLNNPSGNTAKTLVSLRENATSFKAYRCDFQNTQNATIVCRSAELDAFIMTDCTFQSTSKTGGNGSAIYAMAKVENDDAGNGEYYGYSQIHRFELKNVTFSGCTAGGYGGAVALHGYIHSGLISGCSFKNCESTGQGGGAIDIAGNIGGFTIEKTTFENCTSKYRGGAIEIRSADIYNNKGDTRWTRSNTITVSGCTFTNCDSTSSHGGGIAVQAQLHTLNVSDCDFTNCDADANGGAISIDCQDLPDDFKASGGPDWCANITCPTCSDFGTAMSGNYDWLNKSDAKKTTDKKSWINTVNITNGCTFTTCSAVGELDAATNKPTTGNGGAIEFAYGCYIKGSATIDGATIDGCKALGEGSAIFWSNCYVNAMSLSNSTIQNCDFTNYASKGPGGTVKTTGNTTIVLEVTNCDFLNNSSHYHGGGLYWNAARVLGGTDEITECAATVSNCDFVGNSAHNYGGGIYTESKLTITQCRINNNSAVLGGGIAQQVYDNPGARMLDEGGVSELKLDPQTWIRNNTATHGGGVSIRANATGSITNDSPIAYTVRFELNGAAVYDNVATGNGGGIYFIAESYPDNADDQAEVDKYTKVILINAGTGTSAAVFRNKAAGNGGGIYMESSENTELRVQGGYISSNTATNGGGIYMTGKNATCYVEGGTIGGEGEDSAGNPLANKAIAADDGTGGNGGGIAISGGSTIQMTVLEGQTTSGVISCNQAETDGGGIYLDARSDNEIANKITIDEGSVIYNSAGRDGGGISMKYRSEATLNGGEVSHNTAATNGGGMDVYHYANLTVSGGTIEENKATNGNGGGVCARYYGTVEILDGSTIKGNTAGGSGGGIYTYTYNIKVKGGEITENKSVNGAGIYARNVNVDYGENVEISGGSIYKNTASGLGGGIHAHAVSVTISNGNIYENTGPNSGGGIYAEDGATLTITGGSIYKNKVNGGWGGGIYAKDSGTKVTLSGGDICENVTESGNGGGINVEGSAVLTILGGSIYRNTAGENGGGIHSYNNATITMKGGSIYENTAGQAGGGVSLRDGSTATVTNDVATGGAGKITKNTAARGGGVSVESGAELTVTNGYITYNKAVGMPVLSTALHLNDELKGTGGGVYVAGRIYAADETDYGPAEFTLNGEQIAIYGNLADFAADDVFANGDNTRLDVPQKAEMDLADYEFSPEGWFEDYPTNDINYTSGLALAASNSGITNGNVYRYRNSDYATRVLIGDAVVDSLVNTANKYVCMTLGIPAAIPDTVVIDFGLPVDINVLGNEHMYVTDQTHLMSLGAARAEVDGSDWTETDAWNGNQELTLKFGTATIQGNQVRYTPATMEMSGVDAFSYAVKYSNAENPSDSDYYFYYATVTVIPATTIYYEEGFLAYKVYDFETDADVTGDPAYADNQWTTVESAVQAEQQQDRPGAAANDALKALDADNIYGYDAAYANMATYSLGSAMKVTVDSDAYAEATFTFWGTGFDVVSMTSNTTGTILVNVYDYAEFAEKNYAATPVDYQMVDTYYGYKYENGEWVVDDKAEGALYQVPVIKIEGLTYGRYTVVISASYQSFFDHNKADASYDFYLDAIRIYDPANDGASSDIIKDAYVADGEGWPSYQELRNLLINANDFDAITEGQNIEGIIFIDNTLDENNKWTYTVSDYTNFGPNNELYLAPGQSVAFNLDGGENVAGVHLAMKSVGGTVKAKVYDAADTTKISLVPEEIKTATDLYYDITGLNGKTVVIVNEKDSGAILSVTNIKTTYTQAPVTLAVFSINREQAAMAVMSLNRLSEPEESIPEDEATQPTGATQPTESTEPETTEEPTEPEATEPAANDGLSEQTQPTEPPATDPAPQETEPVPEETEPAATENTPDAATVIGIGLIALGAAVLLCLAAWLVLKRKEERG